MSKGADGRRPSCLRCEPPPAQDRRLEPPPSSPATGYREISYDLPGAASVNGRRNAAQDL